MKWLKAKQKIIIAICVVAALFVLAIQISAKSAVRRREDSFRQYYLTEMLARMDITQRRLATAIENGDRTQLWEVSQEYTFFGGAFWGAQTIIVSSGGDNDGGWERLSRMVGKISSNTGEMQPWERELLQKIYDLIHDFSQELRLRGSFTDEALWNVVANFMQEGETLEKAYLGALYS